LTQIKAGRFVDCFLTRAPGWRFSVRPTPERNGRSIETAGQGPRLETAAFDVDDLTWQIEHSKSAMSCV
jgi:hypothetical protein